MTQIMRERERERARERERERERDNGRGRSRNTIKKLSHTKVRKTTEIQKHQQRTVV